MKVNSGNFYITSQAQLDEIISLIKEVRKVAIDTEFTRQTTYYPILSIIQIAVNDKEKNQKTFIIDCISNLDLSGLFEVISDKKITKILHSSTQDLQIFNHKSQIIPDSIIDTQIMANFCGYGFNVGYSNLVNKIFNKQIDKKQQRSDWQRRPLSTKQIEYALLDVIFLEEIYEKFLADLKSRNRFEWYQEEMQNFLKRILSKSEENILKNFAFKDLSPRQIAQIRNLVSWREKSAQTINVPRQHLIKDEVIAQIVQCGAISKNLSSKLSKKMLLEMEEILQNEEEFLEKTQRFYMSEKQKFLFQKAKKLLAKIAAEENFSEQFLLTSFDLKKIICDKSLFDETVVGWRRDLFSKQLQEVIL